MHDYVHYVSQQQHKVQGDVLGEQKAGESGLVGDERGI
jgi:hypothetical protein